MDNLHELALDLKLHKVLFEMYKLSRDLRDMCNLNAAINLLLSNCYKLWKNCNKTRKCSRSINWTKTHQNARNWISVFQNFPGVIPPDPTSQGREGSSWWEAAFWGIYAPVLSACNKLLAVQNNKTITISMSTVRWRNKLSWTAEHSAHRT